MSKLLQYSDLNFYHDANVDARAVKEGFLVRQREYDVIIGDILRNPMKGSVQHYWLVGERGSGKSTLLRRLQIEIDTHEKLTKTYVAINTAGEQAAIYKLYDLLEQVLREMEDRKIPVEWPGKEEDEHAYTMKLFSALHEALERSEKKVILLLDNMDRIFDNLGDDTSMLRAYLLNYKDIKIIGASIGLTDHFLNYRRPFYEFFGILDLRSLTNKEVKELLSGWSEKMDLPQLRDFVENRPGQLETVRLLTDGMPRTMRFFGDILITQNGETSYAYLLLLMDRLTPLYQERLNNLPPSQRKIVLHMALLWEAAGAGELAEVIKMENRLISAQLNQLVGKKIADKVQTRTKNHLYRLSDRCFNLWLILTQGGHKEKRRVKCLTVFLENFYGEKELITSGKAAQFHYIFHKHKEEATPLLLEYIRQNSGDKTSFLKLLLRVWNANFTHLEEDVLVLVKKSDPHLTFTLLQLLIHYQVNLVQKIFESDEFGQELVEQFLPVYYTVGLLVRKNPEAILKISPEIMGTVKELLQYIMDRREFHYGAKPDINIGG